MIDALKTLNIAPNFNLHMIKSKKFKTDLINLYFLRPLTLEEATLNALLTRIIDRGTMKHQSSQLLNQHMDELYGMSLVSDVSKIGERQEIQVKVQYPRSPIIGKNLMEDGVALLKEVVFNPFVVEGKFQQSIFDMEKEQLKQEIESRINDKTSYAVDRCLELMCSEENYRFYGYGDIAYLETVTNEQLYAHYLKVISTSKMDIVVVGDFDFDLAQSLLVREFAPPTGEMVEVPEELVFVPVNEVRYVEEALQIQQGKLVMGYRTQTDRFDKTYYALQLFSVIFGGMPSSKLFMNLREKESLCYFIGTKIDKLKGIMYVVSGIDFHQNERAQELIDLEYDKMIRGEFTEEDIEMAKKALVSSLKSVSDFPNSFANFCYNQYMLGDPIEIDHYVSCYESVTKEEIIEAGKRIQKDLVYFLKGSETV